MEAGGSEFGFTHDAVGNMTSDAEERHYQYDHSNRLRSFRVQIAEAEPSKYALYLYDAAGSRVKKLVRMQGGSYVSTTYIDGVYEYVNDDRNKQNHIYIVDNQSKLGEIRLGNIFGDTTPELKYTIEDHLGGSLIQLQPNGALINKEEYYPFGETSFGSYGLKRYKYCGKERDNESGLYYYGARYYAAWTCRFVSCDPFMAQYAHLSPYNYASNNPVTHLDIDGMQNPAETSSPSGGNGSGSKTGADGAPKRQIGVRPQLIDAVKANGVNIGDGVAARGAESFEVGDYTVTPYYSTSDNISHYTASKFFENAEGKTEVRSDWVFSKEGLVDFKEKVELYSMAANALYSQGPLLDSQIQSLASGDLLKFALNNSLRQWNPENIIFSAGAALTLGTSRTSIPQVKSKSGPSPTPKFKTPTNEPQPPPNTVPSGLSLRVMEPTKQYPDGYWRLEKPMKQGGAQGINPKTLKPGPQHETHTPLPPGYFKKK